MLKNLLLLSGFSTFAVIVIIGFNIYHNLTLSSLPTTTQKRVVAIPSNFDKETITELKTRTPISVNLNERTEVISEDTLDGTPNPTPTSTIQSVASESATSL